VFAHGFGSGIPEIRPLGSGVGGTHAFFQFRGHGRSTAPAGAWTYGDLAHDLLAVADEVGATRAFGVSLGAGALCRLLADRPERFERLVFFLPAVLDEARSAAGQHRLTGLLLAETRLATLAEQIPAGRRNSPAAAAYLRQRRHELDQHPLAPSLVHLLDDLPVPDRAVLARVPAMALVIANDGDELHPVPVARRLAESLPDATLAVYHRPGIRWHDPDKLRWWISDFLNNR
jgi:pimeloyl-ACP methyl ester carboxylesterase